MSSPHQQVVSSIQASQSYSNAGRANEPANSLLSSVGKQGTIAPLRDPRDAKKKKTTNDDVQILAQQGLYVTATESIKNEAKQVAAAQRQQKILQEGGGGLISASGSRPNSAMTNHNNNNNARASSSSTPQPYSNNNNNNNAPKSSSFVSRFSVFSPLDLISGLTNNNNNNTNSSSSTLNTESRHETLVSSGRAAYVKNKRANSASANRFNAPSMLNNENIANINSGNIAKIGKNNLNNNNNNNRPIVEALYTPDVEIERHFLVSDRIKAKYKREGKHVGEDASFKSVPRPDPSEALSAIPGAAIPNPTKNPNYLYKKFTSKPPPVGAYHPHYDATDSKIRTFSFDSPTRTQRNQENMKNRRNSPNSSSSARSPEQTHAGRLLEGSLSQQFGSVGTFDFVNLSQGNFASLGSMGVQDASIRTMYPATDSREMNIKNRQNNNKNHSSPTPSNNNNNNNLLQTNNNNNAMTTNDNNNIHNDKSNLEQNLIAEANKKIPVPEHATFSTQGTSSFASRAPRMAGDRAGCVQALGDASNNNNSDDSGPFGKKKRGGAESPPPPESPWPLFSPSKGGCVVRPTGGGAVGAPLGTFVTPPDLPQKHSVVNSPLQLQKQIAAAASSQYYSSSSQQQQRRANSTPPANHNNNNNNNTSVLNISSSVSNNNHNHNHNQSTSSAISHSQSLQKTSGVHNSITPPFLHHHHQQPPTAVALSAPKIQAQTRKTFLDGLSSPAYNERAAADDTIIRNRASCGIAFDRAPGRYGHSTTTSASLRFQPTRSLGRHAGPEELALTGGVVGGGEKYLDTSAVQRVNTKDDSEVLSTKQRLRTALSFEKQYGNHHDKHSVVAGGDARVTPSSVLTSPIPLEHPEMSFVNSKIPGYVSLSKRGGTSYRKINVFDDNNYPKPVAETNGFDNIIHHDNIKNFASNPNKTFMDLSYPRTRSAIVLKSAVESHQYDNNNNNNTSFETSPSRFSFQQNGNNINKPLDEFRHVRSPAAFFPKTSHSSYIVTRSDGSAATGKNKPINNTNNNNNNNNFNVQSEEPQPIPLERLSAAERATLPNSKGLFNISKSLSREDRDKRWNAAKREDGKGGMRKKY